MDKKQPHIDRRILRSRKAIVEAFDRLLETQDLNQITVSAIAREANIDRKTFYVHFGTIDGLLDALAEERVDEILDAMEEAIGDASPYDGLELAVGRFFEIANIVVRTKLVDNCIRKKSFPVDELLARVIEPFGRKLLERGVRVVNLPEPLIEYYLSFIFGGIISSYRTWLRSDRSVPIEEVSRVSNDLILRGLESLEVPTAREAPICRDRMLG